MRQFFRFWWRCAQIALQGSMGVPKPSVGGKMVRARPRRRFGILPVVD
jgi:hypothetical protein